MKDEKFFLGKINYYDGRLFGRGKRVQPKSFHRAIYANKCFWNEMYGGVTQRITYDHQRRGGRWSGLKYNLRIVEQPLTLPVHVLII